jgi:hypothetical protein
VTCATANRRHSPTDCHTEGQKTILAMKSYIYRVMGINIQRCCENREFIRNVLLHKLVVAPTLAVGDRCHFAVGQ